MTARAAIAFAALLFAAVPVAAQEFREVGAAAAVLYDGPSERAQKRFIVVRGTPLEVVSSLGAWVKVRDHAGDVFWIAADRLVAARHVVVARALASVRRTASDVGELLFQAERGVMLEVVGDDAAAGWLRVRHRDGTLGFVRADETWGR
jgi:SH3-like domain-containing protein